GPFLGADDAGGDGAGQVEGSTDGDDGIADVDVVGVAERHGLEPAHAGDLDDGEVVPAVPAHDGGLGGVAAVEGDGCPAAGPGGLDDVVVGEDVPEVVQDDAGSGAGLRAAGDMQGHHAGQ